MRLQSNINLTRPKFDILTVVLYVQHAGFSDLLTYRIILILILRITQICSKPKLKLILRLKIYVNKRNNHLYGRHSVQQKSGFYYLHQNPYSRFTECFTVSLCAERAFDTCKTLCIAQGNMHSLR